MKKKHPKQTIMSYLMEKNKAGHTAQHFYENISNVEEYREKINRECDELVQSFEDDIVIAQLIHRAILDAVELKDDGVNQWTIEDVVPDCRYKIIFELARKLAEAHAELANKRRALEDVSDALIQARDIVIKCWQGKTPEE